MMGGEMQEKKSQIFSLAFHHPSCTTGFIGVQKNAGWLITSGGLRKMSETIGFIGLGRLGLAMATNLYNAGYALRVYNRTASKAESLVAQGAQLMTRPADVITSGGIVVTVLWDDASVESIVKSDGFLEQL